MGRITGNHKTVTVVQSWPSATAEGATSLVLNTLEEGPIAFVVGLEAIAAIRSALAQLEAVILAGSGRA